MQNLIEQTRLALSCTILADTRGCKARPIAPMPRSALRSPTTPTVAHCKHLDSVRWQLKSTQKLTVYNTRFNTKHLHDATVMDAALPGVSMLVTVSGLRDQPPDLCTVLQVNRSTVDVLRLSTDLSAEYSPLFAVDFFSLSILTDAQDVSTGHTIIIPADATSPGDPDLTDDSIPATPKPHDCPCACEGS